MGVQIPNTLLQTPVFVTKIDNYNATSITSTASISLEAEIQAEVKAKQLWNVLNNFYW